MPEPSQRLGSGLLFRNSLLESSGASLTKKSHLDSKPDGHQGGQKSATGARRGAVGDIIPDVLKTSTSSPSSSSSSAVQLGNLPKFLDQWRNITSNRYMLGMVKGHHI